MCTLYPTRYYHNVLQDPLQINRRSLSAFCLRASEILTVPSLIAQLVKNPPAMQETPV